jgi:hypothetical protein
MTAITLVPIYSYKQPGLDYAELTNALAEGLLEILGDASAQTILVDAPLDTLALLYGDEGFSGLNRLAPKCPPSAPSRSVSV